MIYDVTNIDKVKLIQSLYLFAKAKGFGIIENKAKEYLGKDVNSISRKECEELIENAKETFHSIEIVDYYDGVPLKIDLEKKDGKLYFWSFDYDYRHGKYRSLEAFLYNLSYDEIIIKRKSYGDDEYAFSKKGSAFQHKTDKTEIFKRIINNLEKRKIDYKNRYLISKNDYDFIKSHFTISKN